MGRLLGLIATLAPLSGCYLSHPVQLDEDGGEPVLLDGDRCGPSVWDQHGACEYGTGECIELGARCGVSAGCYDLGAGERRCRPTCRLDQPSCAHCTPSGFTMDGIAYGFCP